MLSRSAGCWVNLLWPFLNHSSSALKHVVRVCVLEAIKAVCGVAVMRGRSFSEIVSGSNEGHNESLVEDVVDVFTAFGKLGRKVLVNVHLSPDCSPRVISRAYMMFSDVSQFS